LEGIGQVDHCHRQGPASAALPIGIARAQRLSEHFARRPFKHRPSREQVACPVSGTAKALIHDRRESFLAYKDISRMHIAMQPDRAARCIRARRCGPHPAGPTGVDFTQTCERRFEASGSRRQRRAPSIVRWAKSKGAINRHIAHELKELCQLSGCRDGIAGHAIFHRLTRQPAQNRPGMGIFICRRAKSVNRRHRQWRIRKSRKRRCLARCGPGRAGRFRKSGAQIVADAGDVIVRSIASQRTNCLAREFRKLASNHQGGGVQLERNHARFLSHPAGSFATLQTALNAPQ